MAEPRAEGAFVWDRIDANRRRTVLLLIAFALASLPAVLYVTMYLGFALGIFLLGFGEDVLPTFALSLLIAAGIVVAEALAQLNSASLVLRVAGARELPREEAPEVWRVTENLCIGAGLPVPSLYVIDTAAANAFATGLSPSDSSLVVTRGLVDLLDRRELEGVIAHEIVQIGNYDTRLSTVLAAGVGTLRTPLAVVIALIRLPFRVHWLLGAGLLLYLGLPLAAGVPFAVTIAVDSFDEEPLLGLLLLLGMAWPLYVLLVAPLLGLAIRSAVLRGREHLADADALLLTRHGEGLARALAKMGRVSSRTGAGAATAHLYVVDPLGENAPFWERLFPTHPPLGERVARLADMAGIPPAALRQAEEEAERSDAAGPETGPAAATTGPVAVAPLPGRAGRPKTAAYRLAGAASLLEAPSGASSALAELPGGALITVVEEEGDFLRVLTCDDEFGYIPRATAMTEVPVGE